MRRGFSGLPIGLLIQELRPHRLAKPLAADFPDGGCFKFGNEHHLIRHLEIRDAMGTHEGFDLGRLRLLARHRNDEGAYPPA